MITFEYAMRIGEQLIEAVKDHHLVPGAYLCTSTYTFEDLYEVARTTPKSFICPVCDRTTYHPTDVLHGYCGACHDYTRGR